MCDVNEKILVENFVENDLVEYAYMERWTLFLTGLTNVLEAVG